MAKWFLTYWPIILFAFNLLGGLILLALHKTYAKKEDVVALDKRVSASESAIDATQKTVADIDTHNIELQLRQLEGKFEGVERLMNRAVNQLDMLVENELKGN